MAATVLITLNSATNPLIFIIRRYSVLFNLPPHQLYHQPLIINPLINFIINFIINYIINPSSTSSSTHHQLHHQPPHQLHHQLHHQPLINFIINPSSTSSSTPHQPLINPLIDIILHEEELVFPYLVLFKTSYSEKYRQTVLDSLGRFKAKMETYK